MTSPPSLAAVIVTYNRAAKLAKVLDALAAQTRRPDAVYVVDNLSTDETPQVVAGCEDLPIIYCRMEQNLGGAGGFHAGLKRAYLDGHDLFWVSDDDAYPEPDAIAVLEERLVAFPAETGYAPGYACSRVNWTDGTLCQMNVPLTVWDWPRWATPEQPTFLIASCSFVSVLITRAAVAEHGLPIAEYFIWHDDVEYTLRLARSYPGLYCLDSLVVHDAPENKGVNYGLVTEANVWKFIYGARNETSRRLRDQGVYGVAVFVRQILVQMKGMGIPFALKRRILAAVWRGLFFRPAIEKL